MTDDRIDRFLRDELRDEYAGSDPPRDAMWEAIEDGRSKSPTTARRAIGWAAGLVAAAVLAVLILGLPEEDVTPPRRRASVEASPVVDHDDLVLREHLARTASFLAKAAAASVVDAALRDDARPLLASTRILMDDPERDPEVARILADAEIALALAVRSAGTGSPIQRATLRATIEEATLVPRLQRASGTEGS